MRNLRRTLFFSPGTRFLGSLAAKVLPTLAKGVASGLLGGVVQSLKGGDGLYMFKRGHSVKIDPIEGNGLYLRSGRHGSGVSSSSSSGSSGVGDGLYLRRGNSLQAVDGNGLIFGPNSPFNSIPILGSIL